MASVERGVHAISDRYVADYSALDPLTASFQGIPGYDDDLPDLSPEGLEARAELARAAVRAMADTDPADDSEVNAKAVFLERIGLEVEVHDAGLRTAELNVIESAPQAIRMIFDLMSTETAEDWQTIATRLAKVPETIASYETSLRYSAERGRVSAIRQVRRIAEQCDIWSGSTGTPSYFETMVGGAESVAGAPQDALAEGARAAAQSYADFARFLRTELAPLAPAEDAVGKDIYALWSRMYLGAAIDLAEAYQWGWAEFTRIEAEMKDVSGRIKPGATLPEVAEVLDATPRYRQSSRAALIDWMQHLSDQALADLRDAHFEIPDELMRLDCKIAPTGGPVGAYYFGPSDDFHRPGTMWWSVPADRDDFLTWRETSTVYHEGVPGHHLQIATAVHEAASLNRFQRLLTWVPGHGEGWALYAERLMHEFGYLSDDGDLLGMLDAHLFRAARVIVDIGMHLKLEIPGGTGFHEGERWTPELGLEFMNTRTITDHAHVRDEIDRYLGWPGQAPAYKLGERMWLSARDEVRARHGDSFDLKDFHMRALRMGPMGLDTLRERLAAF
jgi:uncharacterized protein (DUF885 family)